MTHSVTLTESLGPKLLNQLKRITPGQLFILTQLYWGHVSFYLWWVHSVLSC